MPPELAFLPHKLCVQRGVLWPCTACSFVSSCHQFQEFNTRDQSGRLPEWLYGSKRLSRVAKKAAESSWNLPEQTRGSRANMIMQRIGRWKRIATHWEIGTPWGSTSAQNTMADQHNDWFWRDSCPDRNSACPIRSCY